MEYERCQSSTPNDICGLDHNAIHRIYPPLCLSIALCFRLRNVLRGANTLSSAPAMGLDVTIDLNVMMS